MQRAYKILLIVGGVALAATAASAAFAQSAPDQATPKGFNWEIKDGKRVPKGAVTTAADGTTREEIRKGACVTIKEKSPDGTVRKTSKCD